MNAEILAVGTELLLGDILNTNARYLSQQLAALGINVYYQTVVGDNKERLLAAYDAAFSRADLVITTGGLGPTDDDLTKETAAEFFNRKLVCDNESLEKISSYFKGTNKGMPETNKKQAYIPEGAVILKNPNGTAPGCMIEDNGRILIMLPGPPNEAEPMFENEVKPRLKAKQEHTFVSKSLHLCGIGESEAAEKIRDLMLSSSNPTIAPYAKTGEMLFRITASGKDEHEAKAILTPAVDKIYSILGEYIYGEDDITLAEAVMKQIIERGLKISTAESCTGGMVAAGLIDYPGASQAFIDGVVSYSNESKVRLLGVKQQTLESVGAVSEETAREMAEGIARVSDTDIGLATTGIAGPDGGTTDKPVGLVYIAVSIKGKTTVKKLMLKGTRQKIRSRAVTEILDLLRKTLI